MALAYGRGGLQGSEKVSSGCDEQKGVPTAISAAMSSALSLESTVTRWKLLSSAPQFNPKTEAGNSRGTWERECFTPIEC